MQNAQSMDCVRSMGETQKNVITYSRVGGNYQLLISCFSHLQSVLDLDEAFWALNCIDVSLLRMDKRFLAFLDSNNDGKIRTDEIKEAVRFLLKHLKDGSGFENASDISSPGLGRSSSEFIPNERRKSEVVP